MPEHRNGGSLKDQIYTQLFDSIIRGEYGPEDILSEKLLVQKYNVSKSPIREALIELCNEGVLRSIPRFGYEVIRLTDKDVDEIRQYRLIVECGCLEACWDKLTPEHAQELRLLLERDYHKNIQCSVLEHWERNSEFHLALIACFSNEYLYRNLKAALRVLSRAYAQFFWDKWHRTVIFSSASLHKKTLECIFENDRDRAVEYLRQDITYFAADNPADASQPGRE